MQVFETSVLLANFMLLLPLQIAVYDARTFADWRDVIDKIKIDLQCRPSKPVEQAS